jgi:signal transduction histidine kinase
MLFDPFYTTKQKGTGLGLYISQKILAEHQGSIEVDANLETGTAFVITLPVN